MRPTLHDISCIHHATLQALHNPTSKSWNFFFWVIPFNTFIDFCISFSQFTVHNHKVFYLCCAPLNLDLTLLSSLIMQNDIDGWYGMGCHVKSPGNENFESQGSLHRCEGIFIKGNLSLEEEEEWGPYKRGRERCPRRPEGLSEEIRKVPETSFWR